MIILLKRNLSCTYPLCVKKVPNCSSSYCRKASYEELRVGSVVMQAAKLLI